MADQGTHRSLWRRVLNLPAPLTWHDRHPLPQDWRPRTRIDDIGREVEPWGYTVFVGRDTYDAGEWWLPVGMEPDQAAHAILEHWMGVSAVEYELDAIERRSVRVAARRAGPGRAYVGMVYASETALTR